MDFLRKGTFKFFTGNRNYSFRGDPGSPRKRASKKAAANARG